jgi:hypothetical protein
MYKRYIFICDQDAHRRPGILQSSPSPPRSSSVSWLLSVRVWRITRPSRGPPSRPLPCLTPFFAQEIRDKEMKEKKMLEWALQLRLREGLVPQKQGLRSIFLRRILEVTMMACHQCFRTAPSRRYTLFLRDPRGCAYTRHVCGARPALINRKNANPTSTLKYYTTVSLFSPSSDIRKYRSDFLFLKYR